MDRLIQAGCEVEVQCGRRVGRSSLFGNRILNFTLPIGRKPVTVRLTAFPMKTIPTLWRLGALLLLPPALLNAQESLRFSELMYHPVERAVFDVNGGSVII